MTLESVLRPRSAEMVPFGTDVRFSLTHAEQGSAVKQRPGSSIRKVSPASGGGC